MGQERPSLLCLLPQSPLDTASGAAVSERTTCEMLSRAGWKVKAVGTTASEASSGADTRSALERCGIRKIESSAARLGENIFAFSHRGVDYRLLDTGAQTVDEARRAGVEQIDAMVSEEFATAPPDLVLTYGSSEAEVRRRQQAREAGARVIFSVHNLAYLHPRAFESVDAIVGPSRYTSDFYRRHQDVHVTALPQPVSVDEVVAQWANPTFLTFINPTPHKGVRFFLRIVKESVARGLDLPFLAVESRGTAGLLAKAAEMECLDARSLKNVYVAKNTSDPRQIYSVTRILLMPSLNEAAGRSVVEAQLNRIPVLASDRGGLPETVGTGGFILPVNDDGDEPTALRNVEMWLDLIGRLQSDAAFYHEASESACAAVSHYRSGEVERDRVAYFRSLLR